MTKKIKTNALRQLDQQHMDYTIFTYDVEDGQIDGISVASKINQPAAAVYKTLVTHMGQELFVFVIPVAAELDMKKAARAAGVKKLELLPVKELLSKTGYVRGGCSPVGMKKRLPTIVDASAAEQETIIVSAGQLGVQVRLSLSALLTVTNGRTADVLR
ncbi:Cys-tRNA(Pro) deacylase [Macrococcus equipercicus]|uniref:Cys-tRNA(Pro)/Cys-tRNA(Cys) deacylase n=1 Tax=Macrococcus equipercicus TaxID=69967 RepID=A0ABQ6R944_9STAP|nr:Cys-tRNA(Pro) deacylase [Macrococcus equipercicus]KAA1039669.1 Cys-tRNA(Pro) deacylase [Macrococcus equipercicus]